MNKLLTVLIAGALLVAMAGVASAQMGWVGGVWPTHGYTITEAYSDGFYIQIWKDGVTPGEGQGPGLSAKLYYGLSATGPWDSLAMYYNGEAGNNDEYRGDIPGSALDGQSSIWFYCVAYDSTDASTWAGQDQNSNDPPFMLNVTPALNQDVDVWFFVCIEDGSETENVCITGGHPVLTDWVSGVQMEHPCPAVSPGFYQVMITFPAGSNPYIEYKYRRNECADWESGGNHSLTIDDSSPTMLLPWIDHFSWYDGPDCQPCGVGVEPSSWGKIKKIYE